MTLDNRTLIIDDIDPKIAEALLRRVLRNAEIELDNSFQVTSETRDALLSIMTKIIETEPGFIIPDDNSPLDLSRQALHVLSLDHAYAAVINAESSRLKKTSQRSSEFFSDPISIMGTTSLALIALSTYVNIERNAEGIWSFQFKITPVSDKVKSELLKLLSRLIASLPEK